MIRTHLHDLLAHAAAATPDAPALTFDDRTLGYAELWSEVRDAASFLLSLGLVREDRVAVYLEKRIETVVAIFATSLAGGMSVPVNPVLRAAQVEHILSDAGARFLVTSEQRLGQLAPALTGSAVEHVVTVGAGAPGHAAEGVSVHGWPTDVDGSAPVPPGVDLDPAAILYTSGSTGRPKGVVLSHRNLLAGAESVSTYLGNTSDDVILSVLPLSFDAGLSQLTTAFSVGAHCVLLNYLLPRDVGRACERYGVTGITGVPPLWIQLAAVDWPDAARSALRYFATTGGRMPRPTLDRLRALFPDAQPFLMYGLTEAFRSTYLDPAEIDRRPGSMGKAIPDAEILVLRADGTRCGPGEEGELVHRGPLVALGYWNDPERTAERFRPLPGAPSWRAPERAVWSGDTVVADEEGFLFYVGRRDDMIKTSGYRVSPTEIEEAAYATGLVGDAVAVGVSDVALGERIVLVASPANGHLEASSLLAVLRRTLPHYMVPSHVDVRERLPRSPNGKFDRVLIAAEARS